MALTRWLFRRRLSKNSDGHDMNGGQLAPVSSGLATTVNQARYRIGRIPVEAICFQSRPEIVGVLKGLVKGGETVIITGPDAVGKTQLAAKCAMKTWEDEVIDLLIWVNGNSRAAISDAYSYSGVEVADADESAPTHIREQQFMTFLSTTQVSWLIVLDDVRDLADLRDKWPPRRPNGRVLITTRQQRIKSRTNQDLVRLGFFTVKQSVAYISNVLAAHDRSDVRTQIAGLVSDLGCSPLLLAQAAAFIADSGTSLAHYRERIAEIPPQPSVSPYGDGLVDDQRVIADAVLRMSLQYANEQAPHGLARPMLELVSILDPNGIPSGIFNSSPVRQYLQQCRADNTCALGATLSSDDAVAALQRLEQLALIEPPTDSPRGIISMHPVVRHATKEQLSDRDRRRAALAAADALVASWPTNERDGAIVSALRSNADILASHSSDVLWQSGVHPLLFLAGTSLSQAVLVTDSNCRTAVQYWQIVYNRARRLLGDGHVDTLHARGNLAYWHGRTGDAVDVELSFEQLLNDSLHILNEEKSGILDASLSVRGMYLSNLGLALQSRYARTGNMAEVDEAIAVTRNALTNIAHDPPARAVCLCNLGLALQSRYARTGNMAEVDEAIAVTRDGLANIVDDPRAHAIYISNLSAMFLLKFARSGLVSVLDEAVKASRMAVEATFAATPDRVKYLSSLGSVLLIKYEQFGELTDLDDAITTDLELLASTSVDLPERPRYLYKLGLALKARYVRNRNAADLDAAIGAIRSAVDSASADDPDQGKYQTKFRELLEVREERFGRLANQDE